MNVLPAIFGIGVVLCTLFVPAMLAALWNEHEWSARWEEWWRHNRPRWWPRHGR
jgi:hypothetical protein